MHKVAVVHDDLIAEFDDSGFEELVPKLLDRFAGRWLSLNAVLFLRHQLAPVIPLPSDTDRK